jgi:DMSO/TMAO reductase YedYZ molybdopterin-dependent catalytic subunit
VPLFVVKHQHSAERCPARDEYFGAMLLNHLSRPNVARHGIRVQGEAILRDEHTLYLIVETDDEANLREFLQPFRLAGTVDVHAARTCAGVVASGGCAAPIPASDLVPAVNAEDACQQAIEDGLVVHRAHPLNCETSIPALIGGTVMPNARFYVRNHFQIPDLDAAAFRLRVGGLVDRPQTLSMRDLFNMRSRTQVVTLECAGNGRTLFDPPIAGEKWNLGAVSTAEWTGVPLSEVLDRVGVRAGAREVLFRGADRGLVDGRAAPIRFERSLRLDHAHDGDVLLAYAMNGEPLPQNHGRPLRLIVPGWYAVASVKWLTDIELIAESFDGYYQNEKYWFEWTRDGRTVREPVTLQCVRSLIIEPGPYQELRVGEFTIRGVAWSGAAPIERVEVSVGGNGWQDARLVGDRKRGSWQWWELIGRIDTPGHITIRARATDLAGRTQPQRAEWNRLGYGNNGIHEVGLNIVA